MSDNHLADAPTIESEVQIEAFGVPGTWGRFASPLASPASLAFVQDAFWIARPARERDLHAGFVSDIHFTEVGTLRIRVIAPTAYRLWVDDEECVTGPLRFAPAMPEFQECKLDLGPGAHRVCLHVHHEGITTRMAAEMPAFVWVDLHGPLAAPVRWFGKQIAEYEATGLRVSPLLGWMEATRSPQTGAWRTENVTDSSAWQAVVRVKQLETVLGRAVASPVQLFRWPELKLQETGRGVFRDAYTCYRHEDPAVQFMVADPAPDPSDDVDGIWYRFDLQRIRIGSLEFDVNSDSPGQVTIAYAEKLGPDGRPLPLAMMSTGPTRFLQNFAVGSGCTPVRPLQALGARYLEVRLAARGNSSISNVRFRERDWLGSPVGKISLGDSVLEQIWQVGIDTMRSSTEDSVVDSVRERAEWIGDLSAAAIELLSVGWGQMAPVRRALFHAAASARIDGMVAGCGPGELIYLGTYAAQWVGACVRCAELEGRLDLLKELEGPAHCNIRALLASIRPDGKHTLPWSFVDWGYVRPSDDVEVAALAHVISALDSWVCWQSMLGRPDVAQWQTAAAGLRDVVRKALTLSPLSYHAAVLCERIGLVETQVAAAITLRQLRSSFPFDPAAKRLRDPTQGSADVSTPYFTNFSMDLLLRAGFTDEVMDLWRKGWGWMLGRGATTWFEVFDDRWSHCHYWAGAPTWQMSRRILGLMPVLHDGRPAVRVAVYPGSLPCAEGTVPLCGAGLTKIRWERQGAFLCCEINCPAEWTLLKNDGAVRSGAGVTVLKLSSLDGRGPYIP
jgi:hypothetical protein